MLISFQKDCELHHTKRFCPRLGSQQFFFYIAFQPQWGQVAVLAYASLSGCSSLSLPRCSVAHGPPLKFQLRAGDPSSRGL